MNLTESFKQGKRLFRLRNQNQNKALAKFWENYSYNEAQKRKNNGKT